MSLRERTRLEIDVGESLTVDITRDETVWRHLGRSGRREAAGFHQAADFWIRRQPHRVVNVGCGEVGAAELQLAIRGTAMGF